MMKMPPLGGPTTSGGQQQRFGSQQNNKEDYKSNCGAGMPKTKAESADGKKQLSNGMYRQHRILTDEEKNAGKGTRWMELEIHGKVKSLSPGLWNFKWLTALFLNGNHLTRIPPEIAKLANLTMLDLSHNKLRSLPVELGDMISLCHLYLNSNQLRVLPYELGKLFRLQTLGLQGNPLSPEISKIYHDQNGSQKLLQFLLDHLATREKLWHPMHKIASSMSTAPLTNNVEPQEHMISSRSQVKCDCFIPGPHCHTPFNTQMLVFGLCTVGPLVAIYEAFMIVLFFSLPITKSLEDAPSRIYTVYQGTGLIIVTLLTYNILLHPSPFSISKTLERIAKRLHLPESTNYWNRLSDEEKCAKVIVTILEGHLQSGKLKGEDGEGVSENSEVEGVGMREGSEVGIVMGARRRSHNIVEELEENVESTV